ncbi:MAG: helix-turn-helix transcriptional regulator [Bacteroidaceae bacterium]|nr:helix-turn-helix transcriptional regulator [Bacteroidaceae bacterium]
MRRLNIKAALTASGMTARELAARLDTSPMNVNGWINGRNVNGERMPPAPSVITLQRIAAAIGCDLFDLFDDDDQSESTAAPAASGFIDYRGTIHRITAAADLLRLADMIRQDIGGPAQD